MSDGEVWAALAVLSIINVAVLYFRDGMKFGFDCPNKKAVFFTWLFGIAWFVVPGVLCRDILSGYMGILILLTVVVVVGPYAGSGGNSAAGTCADDHPDD